MKISRNRTAVDRYSFIFCADCFGSTEELPASRPNCYSYSRRNIWLRIWFLHWTYYGDVTRFLRRIGLLVTFVSHAKTAEPIEMPFGGW